MINILLLFCFVYLLYPAKSEDNSSLILLDNPDTEEDGDGEGEDDEED